MAEIERQAKAIREFMEIVGTAKGGADEATPRPPSAISSQNSSDVEVDMMACKRWAANGELFRGAAETYDKLPAGLYRTVMTQTGPALVRMVNSTDSLLRFPDTAVDAVVDEFKKFWQLGPKFREHGFLHKRGFLLWGPPGSGKTSCLQLLIKELVEAHEGVVMFLECPETAIAGLQMARKIEPDRPVIAVMEDIDALIRRFGEAQYLSLLDGEAQVDNIVFLATTNYPELLDKRMTDRPSRFDTIEYVGMPSALARSIYFKAKVPDVTPDELEEWVDATDGLSLAHLKELIISVRCFGVPVSVVRAKLEAMHERVPSSSDKPDGAPVGMIPLSRRNAAAKLGRIGGDRPDVVNGAS